MLGRSVAAIEKIAGTFLFAIAALTFVMVILRKFFDTAIPDWFDFSRLLQGIAIFWGIAAACYRGGHILVDLVWDLSSPRNRRRIDLFAGVTLLSFLGCFAFFALQEAIELRGKNLLTSDLRIPQWGFYAIGALGIVASVIATLARLRLVMHAPPGQTPRGEEPAAVEAEAALHASGRTAADRPGGKP